jgi:integrase
MIERAAASTALELKAHPHMLRHACGYGLANKGHDTRAIQRWLGHRSITSTAVYTALARPPTNHPPNSLIVPPWSSGHLCNFEHLNLKPGDVRLVD